MMNITDLALPVVVESREQLAAMLEHVDRYPVIAIDTESNSLYAYRERVCLIQVSSPDRDYIVDTLRLSDISAMGSLFADPEREKVLHGSDYDVGTLHRDFGFECVHIFDTMIASRILGIKRFGLGNLLKDRFGVTLDKRMQRHDWSRRPLQETELRYAQLDTHFLLPLRDQLLAELVACGREREAREAFERAASSRWNRKPFDPEGFWRMKDASKLGSRERGVLKALYVLREEWARKLDWPPFKVMSDQTLIEISRLQPAVPSDLRHVRGLPGSQMDRLGGAILRAVKRGSHDPQEWSKRPDPRRNWKPRRNDVVERYEQLRAWRKARAEERDVAPDVLISNSQLMSVAESAPTDMKSLSSIEVLGDYQLETYGKEIVAIVRESLGG